MIVFILLLFLPLTAHATHLHKEAVYRDAWCKGETEVRLPNGNRADCITTNHAIEIEFASKWHEAIGQALDYADQTGKQPAVLIIIETPKDWRYYKKARRVARHNGIKLWYITSKQLK